MVIKPMQNLTFNGIFHLKNVELREALTHFRSTDTKCKVIKQSAGWFLLDKNWGNKVRMLPFQLSNEIA